MGEAKLTNELTYLKNSDLGEDMKFPAFTKLANDTSLHLIS